MPLRRPKLPQLKPTVIDFATAKASSRKQESVPVQIHDYESDQIAPGPKCTMALILSAT